MDSSNLAKAIETAFNGVEQPTTSLRQFLLLDKYSLSRKITDVEWTQAARAREESKWQDIPDSEIDYCGCLLAHMGAEDFRYYLPVYMKYSVMHLLNSTGDASILGSTVFSLSAFLHHRSLSRHDQLQFSLLDRAQVQVVVRFLRFVARLDNADSPDAITALEQYWSKKVEG